MCSTGDAGAEMMAGCLPHLHGLCHLVLSSNKLTDRGALTLAHGLAKSCSTCRVRARPNPGVTHEAAWELASVQKTIRSHR